MDTGIAIKPTPVVIPQDHAPGLAASLDPTATELPAAKTVTPAGAAPNAAAPAARGDTPATTHEVIIDPQTREVIYRILDVRSRQVVRQVPDEALLRVRAYAAALAKGDSPSKAQSQADLEV
jgi:hypothetical protein